MAAEQLPARALRPQRAVAVGRLAAPSAAAVAAATAPFSLASAVVAAALASAVSESAVVAPRSASRAAAALPAFAAGAGRPGGRAGRNSALPPDARSAARQRLAHCTTESAPGLSFVLLGSASRRDRGALPVSLCGMTCTKAS